MNDDWDTVYANRPAKPNFDKVVEVMVVAKRCVYVNDRRIAGGKPYYSENLPSHTLRTKLGDVLNAFTDKEIRAALREQKAEREYFASYHASKKAVSA